MEEIFEYNKELHKGFVNGVLIPSITQLVAIKFPMGMIKKEVLDKASDRGTNVHQDIELFNIGVSAEPLTREGKNWKTFVELASVEIVDSERMVLIKDYDGHIIAYGTFDILFRLMNDTIFGKKGELCLGDYKTVSTFENDKVELQLNLYKLGFEQMNSETKIDKLVGIWLRDEKAQFRHLQHQEEVLDTAIFLVKEWEKQNVNV